MIAWGTEESAMAISDPHVQPAIALAAGVLLLLMPRALTYVIALALIVYGLIGLNAIYKFVGG
jgi:hypothetical protein